MKTVAGRKHFGLFTAVFITSLCSSRANGQDFSGYDLSTVERVNAAREAKSRAFVVPRL
jgi:hypothetical protein